MLMFAVLASCQAIEAITSFFSGVALRFCRLAQDLLPQRRLRHLLSTLLSVL